MRKIAQVTGYSKDQVEITVRVYRDAEWDEYRVRLYHDGKLQERADAFASDRDDAFGTMNAMLAFAQQQFVRRAS